MPIERQTRPVLPVATVVASQWTADVQAERIDWQRAPLHKLPLLTAAKGCFALLSMLCACESRGCVPVPCSSARLCAACHIRSRHWAHNARNCSIGGGMHAYRCAWRGNSHRRLTKGGLVAVRRSMARFQATGTLRFGSQVPLPRQSDSLRDENFGRAGSEPASCHSRCSAVATCLGVTVSDSVPS